MDKVHLALTIFGELANPRQSIFMKTVNRKKAGDFSVLFVEAVSTLEKFFKFDKEPNEEQISKAITFLSIYMNYYRNENKTEALSNIFDAIIDDVTKILIYKFGEGKDVQEKQ